MLNKFKIHLNDKLSINDNDKILLTISGGADSVAMLDLFAKSGFECGIAHCNFHLRGSDSDKDEVFVRQLSKKYNYPFFKKDFNTEQFAKEKGISVEMAARQLRYEWFEQIRKNNHYDYIATAHHSDDVIETFFLNLVRGTGIRGLSGIKPVSGKIIRPLLFADKKALLKYIDENKLKYRQDATNYDVKYKRNKLRNDIIPQLADINPAYKQNILKTIGLLDETNSILQDKINAVRNNIVHYKNNKIYFEIDKILALKNALFYLYELLYPYGFNPSQTENIFQSLKSTSGKIFYSANYQANKDRTFLILSPYAKNKKEHTVYLNDYQSKIKITNNLSLQVEFFAKSHNFTINKNPNIALLDKDKLSFPLIIRKWQKGDYFYPLGMTKKKKLSNFFIDNKLSRTDKDSIFVMLSGEDIVWIIGKRIDNRFKITETTRNILQITSHIS